MNTHARVENGLVTELYDGTQDIIIGDIRHGREILRKWTIPQLQAIGIEKVTRNPVPPFDPANEKAVLTRAKVGGGEINETWAVVPLDATERRGLDEARLREALLDVIILQIKSLKVLRSKGAIAPSDFDDVTRQSFQDLEAIADRVRP